MQDKEDFDVADPDDTGYRFFVTSADASTQYLNYLNPIAFSLQVKPCPDVWMMSSCCTGDVSGDSVSCLDGSTLVPPGAISATDATTSAPTAYRCR